jgi:hypothetical protein
MPARKSCHRQIKAAPKEMHRAYFANKAGAKRGEDAIGLQ